jgi:histone deacetylase 1/2
MAFPSSSSAVSAAISLTTFLSPVIEKLTRANHQSWKAQVVSALRGAQLADWLESTATAPSKFLPVEVGKEADPPKPNPDHAPWVAKDQMVLSYLLTNLSKEILGHVNTEVTAKGAWMAIEVMFASQSRAKVISTRMALANATKGASTIGEYFAKIKSLADEMAAAGRRLEDEEIISYLLNGLDADYDSVATPVANRVEPISVSELFTQLVAHEQRLDLRNGGSSSTANMAAKGGRNGGNGGNNSSRGGGGHCGGGRNNGGRGNRDGFGRGSGSRSNFQAGLFCQVCGKEGHLAFRYFKRFDRDFTGPPQKSASSATTQSYGVDTNWYMDTGATDHITSELEKLTSHDKYHGGDQVHTPSGLGMEIQHIGHGVLRSPFNDLHLKNVLHVPSANKDLLSVNRLARDNHVFFLSFTRITFVLRSRRRRELFPPGHVEVASTLSSRRIKKCLEYPSFLRPCGTIG